uniref:Large ribosomal subunit protein bL32c n=1 Tax=Anemone narcissiflora TaxID=168002 RepID=A0A7L8Y944_9MAGN|nr:plastid ribosomal protein L32 [Anemone narcissiflora]
MLATTNAMIQRPFSATLTGRILPGGTTHWRRPSIPCCQCSLTMRNAPFTSNSITVYTTPKVTDIPQNQMLQQLGAILENSIPIGVIEKALEALEGWLSGEKDPFEGLIFMAVPKKRTSRTKKTIRKNVWKKKAAVAAKKAFSLAKSISTGNSKSFFVKKTEDK